MTLLAALADRIVDEILDNGLVDSSWREDHPEAYEDLLDYRMDMAHSVYKILRDDSR